LANKKSCGSLREWQSNPSKKVFHFFQKKLLLQKDLCYTMVRPFVLWVFFVWEEDAKSGGTYR
jgi:hypothetical protein